MKTGLMIILIIFGIVAVGVTAMVIKQTPKIPSNSIPINEEDLQIVNLGMANYNYAPNVITVKQGQPVRIVADMSQIKGCYQYFTIPDLKVKKLFTANDNYVDFIPMNKGTYEFRCSMGMGRGTLIVE